MNIRKVDKTKKSNIKCEHCEAYDKNNGWCRIQEKKRKIIGTDVKILYGIINIKGVKHGKID